MVVLGPFMEQRSFMTTYTMMGIEDCSLDRGMMKERRKFLLKLSSRSSDKRRVRRVE